MGWSYGDADRIAKMIPNELGITLAGVDKKNKETGRSNTCPGRSIRIRNWRPRSRTSRRLRTYGKAPVKLEGLTRGTGVHAAGVVIGDRDLSEYIPLTRATTARSSLNTR
jgi:DNA polymerase-3 subunit alpha